MGKLQEAIERIEGLDHDVMVASRSRVDSLIKPKGSLGTLEEIVVKLSGIQGTAFPEIHKKAVIVCAGDHKIIEEGVATSQKNITLIQAINMTKGVTGVCALAKQAHAQVVVVDVGIDDDYDNSKIVKRKVKYGSDNFRKGPAMTRPEAIQALEVGIEMAETAVTKGVNLIATGEMGIGNTTPSAAIVSVVAGVDPEHVTGVGANLPIEKLAHKARVIREGIALNQPDPEDGIDILSKVGGLEIGAMAGVMIGGASKGVAVVVDGFISTAAALLAVLIEPKVKDYLFASHASLEQGAKKATELLGLKPVLHMNMRLGEGTGAVLMFHMIEAAVSMNQHMLTFEESGFSVD